MTKEAKIKIIILDWLKLTIFGHLCVKVQQKQPSLRYIHYQLWTSSLKTLKLLNKCLLVVALYCNITQWISLI